MATRRKTTGHGRGLDDLIAATADATRALADAADFYAGRRRIPRGAMPDVRLKAPAGLIRIWERACGNLRARVADVAEVRFDALEGATNAFLDGLRSLLGRRFARRDDDGDFAFAADMRRLAAHPADRAAARHLEDVIGVLIRTLQDRQMCLERMVCETYAAHPEWDVDRWYEPFGPSGVAQAALAAYYASFGAREPLEDFHLATRALDECATDDPRAFVRNGVCLDRLMRTCLTLDPCYSYDDGVRVVTAPASMWITEAKWRFLLRLRAYLEERRDALPTKNAARRLWTEALADFEACRTADGVCPYAFGAAEAKAFLARANAAAREEWVARDDGQPASRKGRTGFSRHRGESFNRIAIGRDGQSLTIVGTAYRFTGGSQWAFVDALFEAWLKGRGNKAKVGAKREVRKYFSTKDGQRFLRHVHFETYEEAKRSPGKGNNQYTGYAWFVV